MFGLSYGEIFLLLGATATLIGPKDLPIVARTAGRLAGRAIGYVQLARGQFENVMQQTQARQVHKELQDTMAQLEAIRHEIRSISVLNPGPMTRRLVDDLRNTSPSNDDNAPESPDSETASQVTGSRVSAEQANAQTVSTSTIFKGSSSKASDTSCIHSQATAFARLSESLALKNASSQIGPNAEILIEDPSLADVLPVSAESAGLLQKHKDDVKGSDIVLEAILEAEVAHNAKDFFAQIPESNKI
ncbi:hypothetical protein K2173_018375 [Erythroxylum novogranatense]|uniref:Sec-independent protein translocase protein TatB n=1 Tax=Erythroxylum novogranatense TaxID=1862640 RepID=A0AAV8UD50_9ROSI|nr:hypothetical protein K2173_018375 [Erythroxylum novogranatense]